LNWLAEHAIIAFTVVPRTSILREPRLMGNERLLVDVTLLPVTHMDHYTVPCRSGVYWQNMVSERNSGEELNIVREGQIAS
jgi:hypothetical protein